MDRSQWHRAQVHGGGKRPPAAALSEAHAVPRPVNTHSGNDTRAHLQIWRTHARKRRLLSISQTVPVPILHTPRSPGLQTPDSQLLLHQTLGPAEGESSCVPPPSTTLHSGGVCSPRPKGKGTQGTGGSEDRDGNPTGLPVRPPTTPPLTLGDSDVPSVYQSFVDKPREFPLRQHCVVEI